MHRSRHPVYNVINQAQAHTTEEQWPGRARHQLARHGAHPTEFYCSFMRTLAEIQPALSDLIELDPACSRSAAYMSAITVSSGELYRFKCVRRHNVIKYATDTHYIQYTRPTTISV